MKKVQQKLIALFAAPCVVAATLYILGEFGHVDMAPWADASDQTRFVVSTAMILLTLALIPFALRLFKFKRVNADLLSRKEEALAKWGGLRLFILGTLLVVNTLLYYMLGFEPAFGYLAIVTLLTLPFVLPTMSRCIAETSEAPEPEKEPDAPDNTDEQEDGEEEGQEPSNAPETQEEA